MIENSDQAGMVIEGSKIFLQASMRRPASVTCQAAIIALYCQRQSYNPKDLLNALHQDDANVLRMVHIANKEHKRKGKRVRVTRRKMRKILTYDFEMAHDLLPLGNNELVYVRDILYTKYSQIGRMDEFRRKREARRIVKEVVKRRKKLAVSLT